MPLATWAEEFLLLCRRLSPTTLEAYRRDLRKYVLPRFGAYRLGRIPPDEIENWMNDEIDAGIAPSSVHRHYRTLRRMLQVAVDKQKILVNPCARVQPPRVPKREMAFLSWPEVAALANAHNDRLRTFVYFAVDTGMRWSELVGLRRGDVDVATRKVRVTSQLVRLESGEWLRKEPKTPASIGSITISQFTANLLTCHHDVYSLPGADGLVFPNAAGKPWVSSSFWNNHFRPALARAGVQCRVHDPRHTSVAVAIAAGPPEGDPFPYGPLVDKRPRSTATATYSSTSTRASPTPSTRSSALLCRVGSAGRATTIGRTEHGRPLAVALSAYRPGWRAAKWLMAVC